MREEQKSALQLLKEKKLAFERERILTYDTEKKFVLGVKIDECDQEIKKLEILGISSKKKSSSSSLFIQPRTYWWLNILKKYSLFYFFSKSLKPNIKILVFLLPIIIVWSFVGQSEENYAFSNNLLPLLVGGACGGANSGLLIGLVWQMVTPSATWEEVLLICLPVGAIAGSFVWTIIGNIVGTTILRTNGQLLGTVVGVVVHFFAVLWLSRIRA